MNFLAGGGVARNAVSCVCRGPRGLDGVGNVGLMVFCFFADGGEEPVRSIGEDEGVGREPIPGGLRNIVAAEGAVM